MKKRLLEHGRFLTTQWQVVRQASASPTPEQLNALDHLLRTYGPALVEYLKSHFSFSIHQAEDVVQDFVTDQVLIKNLLASASSSRGKFRTFLLKSIQNYTYDRLREERTLKRHPVNGFTTLNEGGVDDLADASNDHQRLFDEYFVRQILAEVIQRTHQLCIEIEKPEIWEILHARVLSPHLAMSSPVDYETLINELGLESKVEAQNRLASGKRMFKRFLQTVVEEFSADQSEFEEELRFIQRFFADTQQDRPS